MPSIPASEANKLDLADLKAASENDASAMETLLDEVPVTDPAEGEPQQTTRNPNDAAVEAVEQVEADEKQPEKTQTGTETEPKREEEPAEPPAEEKPTADEELEDELKQAIKDLPQLPENAPKHLKEANKAMKGALKERIRIIKEISKERDLTKKELEDQKAEIAKLKEVDLEDYNNLKAMRRNLAIEHDPEFRRQFDGPIKAQEKEAIALLKKVQLPDDVEKWIDESGGLAQFYYSEKPVIDVDTGQPMIGRDGRVVTEAQWFQRNVMNHQAVNEATRDEIKDHVLEARKLIRNRQRAIEQAKSNGEQWEKQRSEQMTKAQQNYYATVEKAAAAESENLGIFATKFVPKPEATEEQKAMINAHNERVDQGVKMFNEFVRDNSPEGKAKASVRAALSYYLLEQNTSMTKQLEERDKELKEAQEKLERFKGAGRVPRDSSSPPTGSPKSSKPVSHETDEQAMDRLMSAMTAS